MLKRLLIFFAIVSFTGAAIFTYFRYIKQDKIALWDLIPPTALFVYESNKPLADYNHITDKNIWQSLALLPGLSEGNEFLPRLIELSPGITESLKDLPLLLSAHKISRNKIGLMWALELKDIRTTQKLNQIIDALQAQGYQLSTRKYLNQSITELKHADNSQPLTFYFHKNLVAISAEPVLIEDVIRNLYGDEKDSFKKLHLPLFSVVGLTQDQGNLYVNFSRFSEFLSVFTNQTEWINPAEDAFLDIKVDHHAIELSGFSFDPNNQFLAGVAGNVGTSFEVSELISNQSALCYHMSFTHTPTWLSNIKATFGESNRWNEIKKTYDIDPFFILENAYQEVAITWHYQLEQFSNLIVIKTTNTTEVNNLLQQMVKRHAGITGDTIFYEEYKGHTLYLLPTSDLGQIFFGNLTVPMEECFYIIYRNYLVLAPSVPAIKDLLDDLEQEQTWKKSLRKRKFLENTNQEAAFSMYLNTPSLWRAVTGQLSETWQNTAQEYGHVFRSLENIAIQFSPVDQKFFTSVIIEQSPVAINTQSKVETIKSISLNENIITRPYLLRTHAHNQFDILVQDTLMDVYYLDPSLDVAWTIDLKTPIKSQPYGIDYFKNGKIQQIFITEDALHIIDRTGNYVDGFPAKLGSTEKLQHLSIVDYDGSKNYRFAIVDKTGKIFITDKEGKILPEWNGKSLGAPLIAPIRHYRSGGTDVFAAVTEDGSLHLMSRRGISYPGFPFKLPEPVEGDYAVQLGANFANSRINLITVGGYFFSINLKGDVIQRLQIERPEPTTTFELISDTNLKQFVLQQKNRNSVGIFSSDGSKLFTKSYLSGENSAVNFFNLGATRRFISVVDRSSQNLSIFDFEGNTQSTRPISATQSVSMRYLDQSDQLLVFVVNGRDLNIIKLSQ